MQKIMFVAWLVGSFFTPTWSTFAADLPFGLALGMSPDKISAIQSGALELDSTKAIMGRGTNCVDHFLAGDGYPSSDEKKYKESVSDFVKRVDVFPDLDVSLYQVDLSGQDTTYKDVCLGFASSELVFLEVPNSSIPDMTAVLASIDSKFKRTETQEIMSSPYHSYIWQASGIEVSLRKANMFSSLYALMGTSLMANRLRYVKMGHDDSMGEKLTALFLKKGLKRKKSSDF